nr:hypothetical protein [Tanacetum cinerariifolium]
MASAMICLSKGQRFNFSRVGKGCAGVETPLFENMLEVREVDAEEEVQVPAQDDVDQENVTEEIADDVAQPSLPLPPSPVIPCLPPYQSPRPPPPQATEGSFILVQQVLDKCSVLVLRVKGLESANTAQQSEILKLKARVKKLERLNKVTSSKLRRLKKVGTSQRIESLEDEENVFNQGRMSVDINEGIELVDDQENDAQVKGRQADTQAEIYNIDLDHTSKDHTSKPTNFTDVYLLVTLKNMFEKTDAQDVIWRSQQTEHGQALVKSWKLLTSCGAHIITFTTIMFVLLVEKKYPLSRFTLE